MSTSRDGGPIRGRAARALAAAAQWRLLGLLLERPRDGWHQEVAALAAETDHRALRAAAGGARGATESTYLAAFGPGGAVSPREVGHRPFADPGWVLADLARFYDAFGFRPRAEDPPDHVAVEAGFVGYLLLKEAYAAAREDGAAADVAAEARREFLGTHLGELAHPLARALARRRDGAPLAMAARALAARVPRPRGVTGAGPPAPAEIEGCAGCPGG
jgi:nitrate reductase assembly molybdenum cofactor insertion protein NarJ